MIKDLHIRDYLVLYRSIFSNDFFLVLFFILGIDMIEVSEENIAKIKEYLITMLPVQALESFESLVEDIQQEDFKKKDHYKYSKAYLIFNYLNWLVSRYTLEDLKNFTTTKEYYNSAPTIEKRPSSCIVGAAFNNPSMFPTSLNDQSWKCVKEFVLSGNNNNNDSEFLTINDDNVSNFLNILPVLLLNEQAVCRIQLIHDNYYYLRNMIENLLYNY